MSVLYISGYLVLRCNKGRNLRKSFLFWSLSPWCFCANRLMLRHKVSSSIVRGEVVGLISHCIS